MESEWKISMNETNEGGQEDSIAASSGSSCESSLDEEENNDFHINWNEVQYKPEKSNLLDDKAVDCLEEDYEYLQTITNIPEEIKSNPKPYDFFKLLLPDYFIDHIVRETNRYADQTIVQLKIEEKKPYSLINTWKPIDREDIMKYIGLILLCGLHKNIELKGT